MTFRAAFSVTLPPVVPKCRQRHGEVYDVTHNASDILVDMQESEQPVGDFSRYPLTYLDKHRKLNPRAVSRYIPVTNSLSVIQFARHIYCCAIHLPQRGATSQHGYIFDDVGHIYPELVA